MPKYRRDEHRRGDRELSGLAAVTVSRPGEEAGTPDPELLAGQLVLLYDGAGISAWMDHDPGTVRTSISIAATLIDAAIPGGTAMPGSADCLRSA